MNHDTQNRMRNILDANLIDDQKGVQNELWTRVRANWLLQNFLPVLFKFKQLEL